MAHSWAPKQKKIGGRPIVARKTSRPKRSAPRCLSVKEATVGKGSQAKAASPLGRTTGTALLARRLGGRSSWPSRRRTVGVTPGEKSSRAWGLKW